MEVDFVKSGEAAQNRMLVCSSGRVADQGFRFAFNRRADNSCQIQNSPARMSLLPVQTQASVEDAILQIGKLLSCRRSGNGSDRDDAYRPGRHQERQFPMCRTSKVGFRKNATALPKKANGLLQKSTIFITILWQVIEPQYVGVYNRTLDSRFG